MEKSSEPKYTEFYIGIGKDIFLMNLPLETLVILVHIFDGLFFIV